MPRILIADDDPEIRDLIAAYLSRFGYHVLSAADGLEAVDLFRACPDIIDLVITDMTMPAMPGQALIQEIRAVRPDAGVICMTGYSHAAIEGTPVLRKPFRLELLGDMVRQALTVPVSEPLDAN